MLTPAGAIAGAEERGTIDVLLGNPFPRWQLVVGSFLSMALSLLGILPSWASLPRAPPSSWTWTSPWEIRPAVLNMWPLCLLFGAVALLCSALFHRRALAISVPASLLFAMYLLDTLGRVSEDLEDCRPASAFYYYGSAIEDGIDWAHFGGSPSSRSRSYSRDPRLPPPGHLYVAVSPALRPLGALRLSPPLSAGCLYALRLPHSRTRSVSPLRRQEAQAC